MGGVDRPPEPGSLWRAGPLPFGLRPRQPIFGCGVRVLPAAPFAAVAAHATAAAQTRSEGESDRGTRRASGSRKCGGGRSASARGAALHGPSAGPTRFRAGVGVGVADRFRADRIGPSPCPASATQATRRGVAFGERRGRCPTARPARQPPMESTLKVKSYLTHFQSRPRAG